MRTNKNLNLTEGNISKLLTTLTIPMIFGMLGIVIFNLSDTYFVGKLGTVQMAALTFTFPVVLVINSINHGLGIGASVVISRAVGEYDKKKVKRLSTDSLTLGVLFSVIAVIIGELTIEPLFTMLGADENIMPYIIEYMQIWYAGAPFVVIPMVGNNAIRALGDTKTPSIVMMVSAATNIILDPILIFGLGFIPALDVAGAAIATVISRAFTCCFAIYVLVIREKVIILESTTFKRVIESWKTILYIGIPNAVAKMIIPIGAGIITGLVATFGTEVVAGYGIATRIEFLALSIVMSLASVIPVFVGQNFGAGRLDRIREGVVMSEKFSILFGILLYGLLALLARPISYLFTQEKEVSDVVVLYMWIVPLGYTFQGVLQILNGALNAIHQPIKASAINLTQMLVVYVPMAFWASKQFGIIGILSSLIASYFVVGILSHFMFKKSIDDLAAKEMRMFGLTSHNG